MSADPQIGSSETSARGASAPPETAPERPGSPPAPAAPPEGVPSPSGGSRVVPPPPVPPQPGDRAPGGAVPVGATPRSTTTGGVIVGKVVEGSVVAVHPTEVEVRLVDGRIGVIPRSEFEGKIDLGEVVEAALLARDDPKSRAVLSRSWAVRQRAWERVEAALAEHTALTGPVTRSVKGGVVVDLGLRAFLPASLFPEGAPGDGTTLVGTEVEVLVVEANRANDRVVVSAKDLERRNRRAREREAFRSLEVGARVTGKVVSTAEHGAIVDLGGVRGLVHRSELAWGRINRVDDVVSVGDDVEVVVLDVNRSRRRVSLSLRATVPDPYAGIEPGTIHSSTVTRVVEYGAFVRIEPGGAEGLVHISELSDVPGYRPDQLVAPGEQVMVKVLDVDRKRHRLSLSVRRVLVDE